MTQEDLNKWNKEHVEMGRPEYYVKRNDDKLEKLRAKKVFKLVPLAIPKTQRIKISNNLTK